MSAWSRRLLPLILFIAGVGAIIFSLMQGRGGAGIFIIFPVIYTTGILGIIGVLLIMLSLLSLFFMPFRAVYDSYHTPIADFEEHDVYHAMEKREKRYGGILLIGPFPIIFGTDREMMGVLIIIALIMIAIFIILLFHLT
ncbi:MAG: hypothetical protein DRN20_01210 [Thermoplasmata archaeon]|nr:MAG: hypothetical protein DRN20_01210 [Thermoplasmata archaeon]